MHQQPRSPTPWALVPSPLLSCSESLFSSCSSYLSFVPTYYKLYARLLNSNVWALCPLSWVYYPGLDPDCPRFPSCILVSTVTALMTLRETPSGSLFPFSFHRQPICNHNDYGHSTRGFMRIYAFMRRNLGRSRANTSQSPLAARNNM